MTTTINSAADVVNLFPGANFGADGIYANTSTYLNCTSAEQGNHIIDDELTSKQVLALAYWLTHLKEFDEFDEYEPAEDHEAQVQSAIDHIAKAGITSADVVKALFPGADISRDSLDSRDAIYLLCDRKGNGGHIIDGTLTSKQVLALAYWLEHPEEFDVA